MLKKKLEELERLTVEDFKGMLKIPIVVVLDNIRSAMNVGSFFRTADAFIIQEIILCGITATPPHKEILKTAIGSTMSVKWSYLSDIANAVDRLHNEDFQIIGIEQTHQSISLLDFNVSPQSKYALIFGNEVEGISDSILERLDSAIEIPQYGTKHSLNVAVCGGIVMWHFANPFFKI